MKTIRWTPEPNPVPIISHETKVTDPVMKLKAVVIDVVYYLPRTAPVRDDISSCFPKIVFPTFHQDSIYFVLTEFQPCPGQYTYAFDEGTYEISPGEYYQEMRNRPNENNGCKYESPIVQCTFDDSVNLGHYSMGRKEVVWSTFQKTAFTVFKTTDVKIVKQPKVAECVVASAGVAALCVATRPTFSPPASLEQFGNCLESDSIRSTIDKIGANIKHLAGWAAAAGIVSYVAYNYTSLLSSFEREPGTHGKFLESKPQYFSLLSLSPDDNTREQSMTQFLNNAKK